ncbi:MAG: uL15m family ribosomal protein [Nanoarchaeota archaeon]|nr:uL15m family ribosomal protein [Nanoarchaeota archaeon]
MQFHNLQPSVKKPGKKRVGRGGKRGTYSGRGQKGQKAHGGRKIPKAVAQIISRLPKLRGSKNRPAKEVVRISLSDLVKYAKEGVVTRDSIITRAKDKKKEVKILANGEVKIPLAIVGIKVSKSAEEKIKKAGGKIV